MHLDLIQRKLSRLLICVAVICAAVTFCSAQQVQIVKSAKNVTCGEKNWKLHLVTAADVGPTQALAIVLTPEDGVVSNNRVFGLYWKDSKTTPTSRDDTSGKLDDKLVSYEDGQYKKQPVLNAFFADAKCAESEPQVAGILAVIGGQVLGEDSRVDSLSLRNLADRLSNQNVAVRADDVVNATSERLELFRSIPDEMGLSKAIRNYVSLVLADESAAELKRAKEEIATLTINLNAANEKIKTLEANTDLPWWLKTILLVTTLLSLGGLALFGLVIRYVVKAPKHGGSTSTVGTPHYVNPDKSSNGTSSESSNNSGQLDEIKKTLSTLTADVGSLKETVNGFTNELDVRFKRNKALQSIWTALNTAQPSKPAEELGNDVVEIIRLHRWLSERLVPSNLSAQQTSAHLKRAVSILDTIRSQYFPDQMSFMLDFADHISTKFAGDHTRLKEFSRIETNVRQVLHINRDVADAVIKIISEHKEVQDKLAHTDYSRELTKAIDSVLSHHRQIGEDVRKVLPGQKGNVAELVAELTAKYWKLKPEADRAKLLENENLNLEIKLDHAQKELAAGNELANEITEELNLKTMNGDERGISATLERLRTERESSVYLQLRFGLTSALLALEKATREVRDEALLEALELHRVQEGMQSVLDRMEQYTGDQLWHKALSDGFGQKWLHYLIRADLLLRTYYADQKEFGRISRAVSLACSTILVALYEFQVEVIEVGLLGELPREMETESVYAGVRNLPAVRDKVSSRIRNGQTEDLVVDITSFPYFVKGVQENRGRAALANPSAWVQH